MLHTKTKVVKSYGKKKHNVVPIRPSLNLDSPVKQPFKASTKLEGKSEKEQENGHDEIILADDPRGSEEGREKNGREDGEEEEVWEEELVPGIQPLTRPRKIAKSGSTTKSGHKAASGVALKDIHSRPALSTLSVTQSTSITNPTTEPITTAKSTSKAAFTSRPPISTKHSIDHTKLNTTKPATTHTNRPSILSLPPTPKKRNVRAGTPNTGGIGLSFPSFPGGGGGSGGGYGYGRAGGMEIGKGGGAYMFKANPNPRNMVPRLNETTKGRGMEPNGDEVVKGSAEKPIVKNVDLISRQIDLSQPASPRTDPQPELKPDGKPNPDPKPKSRAKPKPNLTLQSTITTDTKPSKSKSYQKPVQNMRLATAPNSAASTSSSSMGSFKSIVSSGATSTRSGDGVELEEDRVDGYWSAVEDMEELGPLKGVETGAKGKKVKKAGESGAVEALVKDFVILDKELFDQRPPLIPTKLDRQPAFPAAFSNNDDGGKGKPNEREESPSFRLKPKAAVKTYGKARTGFGGRAAERRRVMDSESEHEVIKPEDQVKQVGKEGLTKAKAKGKGKRSEIKAIAVKAKVKTSPVVADEEREIDQAEDDENDEDIDVNDTTNSTLKPTSTVRFPENLPLSPPATGDKASIGRVDLGKRYRSSRTRFGMETAGKGRVFRGYKEESDSDEDGELNDAEDQDGDEAEGDEEEEYAEEEDADEDAFGSESDSDESFEVMRRKNRNRIGKGKSAAAGAGTRKAGRKIVDSPQDEKGVMNLTDDVGKMALFNVEAEVKDTTQRPELDILLSMCTINEAQPFSDFIATHQFGQEKYGRESGVAATDSLESRLAALNVQESPSAGAALDLGNGKGKAKAKGKILKKTKSTASTPAVMTTTNNFKKLGEASFSEVFGVWMDGMGVGSSSCKIVMKVIPLRVAQEDRSLLNIKPVEAAKGKKGKAMASEMVVDKATQQDRDQDQDGVWLSQPEDVRREIEITKLMSGMHEGFISFLGAYVVQGCYPESLLSEWDAFDEDRGSDSVRPDKLPSDQMYAIILLANGGTDLESFRFSSTVGWNQALSIIVQLAETLNVAEASGRFEHRDLHEGQVLVRATGSHVTATIIDFGLSRVDHPLNQKQVYFSAISDDVFEGEGEQWDVYRAIRDMVIGGGGDWSAYHPFSNVMWLQYLTHYLLKSTASLRKPKTKAIAKALAKRDLSRSPISKRSSNRRNKMEDATNERCYEIMVQLNEMLSECVGIGGKKAGLKGKKKGAEARSNPKMDMQQIVDWLAANI